jgi:hypothetical protein
MASGQLYVGVVIKNAPCGKSCAHTEKIHEVSLFPARSRLKRVFEFNLAFENKDINVVACTGAGSWDGRREHCR